jgi:pyruvate dehydrogenase E2 component (dihydrolipoamide acetyltransferase)
VVQITTEKTTQELLAPASGIVHPVAELGATLPIQGLIGYILEDGEAPPAATSVAPTGGPAPAAPPTARTTTEIRASPVARRLAAEHSVDLTCLVGSGPGGRIVEADVQAAIAAAPPSLAERRVKRRTPLAGVRRTIAERLRASLSVTAQVTLTREVDASVLVQARRVLRERLGQPVPFDAVFVRLFALALRELPDLNASIEADTIVVFDDIHVGFAVAADVGLLVPVVRNADSRSLDDIVADVRSLSERAQRNQLQPIDMAGGTATITNLGAYNIDGFAPIINPPQSAILGIGRIMPRPFVEGGQLTVRETCVLSLSFDHRVVDGAPAAQVLDGVARRMLDANVLTHI